MPALAMSAKFSLHSQIAGKTFAAQAGVQVKRSSGKLEHDNSPTKSDDH
jgi:hypothetical protein